MIPSAVKLSRLVLWIGVISAFTFFSSSTMASSNSTWFTRVWQIDDGLLDNNVNQVVQSRDDYLWLVMPVGVMQFDGNSFRPFRMAEFVPTAASHVRMILRGRAGVLWMASDGGNIIRLNPDFSAVTLVETNLPRTVFVPNAWDEAGDGSLWLGYPDAIFRIQNGPAMKLTAKEGVPSGVFHTLHSDGVGNIWMAKGAEIGFFRNGLFCRTASMQGVQCMAATHTNAIWFVAGQYLFTCDTDGKLRNCGAFQNSIAARTAALLEDHTGAVWIGTDGKGLFRYNGSGFERIETSHAFVLSLAEDREGDIWAGTGGGGLDRVTSSGMRLETMENNQIRPQIESICRDADGVLWGATQNGTLVSRINNQWEPTFTNAPFAGTVTCVAAGGGAVWAGTQNGKLVRLGNTNHAIWETNVGHFAICGLLPTSKGDLWIVGERVLQCFHKGQIENIKLPQDFRNYAIVEDADGYVWLGGDGTLICYNGDSLIYQISSKRAARLGLLGHPICCLYTTADGGIWIGSRGGGLVRIKNGRAEQLGRSQGLVDDYISQIVEDKRGWLWFGSNHGIFKIKKQELDQAMEDHRIHLRPIVYGEDEGLASLEALYSVAPPYVFPRAILDNDGCVRILTYKGVVVANPAVMSGASAPPPVLLTQVVMDEQIIAAYGGVVSFETATNLKVLNTPLRLPPTHRHLEFDFTAFHFSAPENIHFRYQLVGFDTNWIDAGTERSANYSRLPAGQYHFSVEACVGAGPWSEPPTLLAITVIPFFWQAWWFRLGVVLLFTSCVIVFARYISIRRIKMQMRLLEKRAVLDTERTRIARDLHDELGSSLNYISMSLGDMGRSQEMPAKQFYARLEKISGFAVRTVRSLDEIVWAVNPRNDSLRSLVDYITQFATELFEDRNIHCRFHVEENLPQRRLTLETRHHLFLIVKEALGNALVHAHPSEVRLGVRMVGPQVEIYIQDNGIGFDRRSIEANGGNNGLKNMQQRIETIRGRLVIQTKPGDGTTIRLVVDVPQPDRSRISA